MLDCNKIDSLMIDWLYDELDETTTASFDEHVAGCSHCERELASLQRTREAVKDLPSIDPPVAVSNILLHEAAKRAPARKAGLDERPGLFARLAAWFGPALRHPGLAAVACLVLVAGVAGSLYLQGKGGYTGPRAKSRAPAPEGAAATARHETATDDVKAADRPSADPFVADGEVEQSNRDTTKPTDHMDKDQGIVGRPENAEEKKQLDDVRQQLAAQKKRVTRKLSEKRPAKPRRHRVARRRHRSARPPQADVQPTPKSESTGTTAYAGKPYEPRKAGQKKYAGSKNKIATKSTRRYSNRNAPVTRKPVANVVTGADKMIARPKPKPQPQPRQQSRFRGNTRSAGPRPTVNAPPPPPAPGATRGFKLDKKGRAAYRLYKVSPRVQVWTETQHQKLNAAVARNNCRVAARLAADILDRNPNYYYKQVGPTRQIKKCRWYVNREWNRRAKSRARRAPKRRMKKAGGVPAKAKASPRPDLAE